jgi:multimeric flavodoxin WrbA
MIKSDLEGSKSFSKRLEASSFPQDKPANWKDGATHTMMKEFLAAADADAAKVEVWVFNVANSRLSSVMKRQFGRLSRFTSKVDSISIKRDQGYAPIIVMLYSDKDDSPTAVDFEKFVKHHEKTLQQLVKQRAYKDYIKKALKKAADDQLQAAKKKRSEL